LTKKLALPKQIKKFKKKKFTKNFGDGKTTPFFPFQLNFLIIIITRFIDFSCRFSDSSFLSQFFFGCVVCVCGLFIQIGVGRVFRSDSIGEYFGIKAEKGIKKNI
jgi:hypothetical protein